MDDEDIFWLTDFTWPLDTERYVFLARALQQIGAALFPLEWTGSDTAADPLRTDQAISALQWPEGGPEPVADPLRDREAFQRSNRVKKTIAEAAVAGKLITAGRDVAGGEMSQPFPASYWHTENWSWRFKLCRINPAEPFAPGSNGPQWIFVERKTLDEFIHGLQPQASSSTIRGETDCRNWLRAEMTASPQRKPQAKKQYLREAMERFAVSERGFNRAWAKALTATQSGWGRPGQPRRRGRGAGS